MLKEEVFKTGGLMFHKYMDISKIHICSALYHFLVKKIFKAYQ